jgi:hypothetical protein
MWVLATVLTTAATAVTGSLRASSHREAPLSSQDPLADDADVYAFVSPAHPDRVTLIANFIPFEEGYGGPNFYTFDDNVLYEIMVDNDGDAVEDATYQFRFRTFIGNPNTFLYNTGTITSLDSTTFNVKQFYDVIRIEGPRRRALGRQPTVGTNLPTPPVNVGARSTPDYGALAAQAVRELADGSRVFAGQRDDPFFVHLNVFDLLAVPPADIHNFDALAGKNVHTIVIEVPIARLTRTAGAPVSAADPAAIIGVWSTASRPNVTNRANGREKHSTSYVQVSRLGQPLVNEIVIPLGSKANPDHYEACRLLATTYLSLHRFRDALREATRCLASNPRDAFVHGVVDDARLDLGEYTQAFASFDTMNDLKPGAASYARAAYARELQGDLTGAIDVMKMALDVTRPTDVEAVAWYHVQLGRMQILLSFRQSWRQAAARLASAGVGMMGLVWTMERLGA